MKSSTDQTEVDGAMSKNSPRMSQSASMQEPEFPRNHDHEKIGQDGPVFSPPQVPPITG
jgi:hypothetical protein